MVDALRQVLRVLGQPPMRSNDLRPQLELLRELRRPRDESRNSSVVREAARRTIDLGSLARCSVPRVVQRGECRLRIAGHLETLLRELVGEACDVPRRVGFGAESVLECLE